MHHKVKIWSMVQWR